MSERTIRAAHTTAATGAGGPHGDAAAMLFAGPGEMRALCRAHDWAATPLGPVSTWSHALRTSVSIMLASRNPMFLWWGPGLIQLYNDAYRPSFGEHGRHPQALGMPGRECWTDIWKVIGPQIEQVMNGGDATWHEDQYLPIERNGRLEDVWWTYSYSAVQDDDGSIGGTLVVCQETTGRVLAERERTRLRAETAQAEWRAARVLERVSDEHLVMDADFRILSLNAAAERALGVQREALIGRTHWEAFPASVGSAAERHYRRVQVDGVEAHFTHHYVGEGYDRYLEIDAYPTDERGVALFWRDVSTRVRAERALHESAARLRAIYDGTYEYIGLLSPDGTLLEANRASLEFAGNRRDEVVGRRFWDTPWFAATPGAPELVREGVARAAAGEFVRWEADVRRPSGEMMTFDISLHPVRDASGEVALIVPEGRDVTERRRAEAALRESESRYRALFDSLDEGFCVIEVLFDERGTAVDYRFVETNPAFLQQTGLADAVGRTARELLPELEPYWFEIYGRVVRTGEATRFEAPSETMGRYFDVYAFRIGRPDEAIVAILFSDVSAARAAVQERERLLAALQVEQTRLAQVFQRAPSFIVAFRGPEQRYEFVNEAYYQLVGHRDILGKPLFEALPEIRDQGFKELLDRVRETGEPWVGREAPVELQRTPGAPTETRYLDMVFQALTEADGTRTGVVAHGSDVTEQVLARREVERLLAESERARAEAEVARAAAEAADLAKSHFLANMSHELRTPLNAIQGHVQLLAMGLHGPVTEEQHAALARVDRAQRHLLGLVNDVLNYARLGSGRVEYDVEPVLVADVLADVLPMVEPQIAAQGLAVEVHLPERGPTGPTGRPPVRVWADREKLGQVFLNLLSNAIKFTPAGGKITVELTERGDGSGPADVAFLRVADTGIGIPADKLDAVFEPFVQVRTDYARTSGGTGLGLAISRDLARGMGGELRVRSREGAGSAFTITLRRVPPGGTFASG